MYYSISYGDSIQYSIQLCRLEHSQEAGLYCPSCQAFDIARNKESLRHLSCPLERTLVIEPSKRAPGTHRPYLLYSSHDEPSPLNSVLHEVDEILLMNAGVLDEQLRIGQPRSSLGTGSLLWAPEN